MFIVDKAFRDFEYGFAAAAAWLLFLLILLGSMINFFFVSRIRGGTR
jgi:cellobiose transport system permease protein